MAFFCILKNWDMKFTLKVFNLLYDIYLYIDFLFLFNYNLNMNKNEHLVYLKNNYPELFTESDQNPKDFNLYFSSYDNIGIGFFYKVKRDFDDIFNVNNLSDLIDLKKNNKSAIEIFYNYPIKCFNWQGGLLHPGRFTEIEILNNKGKTLNFTSLTGLYGMMAKCKKGDYGIIAIPIVAKLGWHKDNTYFGPFAFDNIKIEITEKKADQFLKKEDAINLLNKIAKDKLVMKHIYNFINKVGDLKQLNIKEAKGLKQFMLEFNEEANEKDFDFNKD